MEEWYVAVQPVPANVTKLYQLLLHMVTMRGTIPVYLALELGYANQLIDEAMSRGFVELSLELKKPSRRVSRQINQIIGIPPPEMSI